ncbi:MAG TPA: hypothetical protein PLY34_19285 [Ferruginibacter sp.]|nr:hypothetical protein [Ferruginibacter sp.]HPH93007.1 hypothetical protein [Ferruginibacter sp.]
MIEILLFIFIIALAIFLYFKNQQYNRAVDRHNRLAEKQEELIEMLRKNNETENSKDEN